MAGYGITDSGFHMKRLDIIKGEIQDEISDGWGVDIRADETSFINVLVTSFAAQIAELWEEAQESYYAKYPYTAFGKSLDNAASFGGVVRAAERASMYPVHCWCIDGTTVPEGAIVATNTSPEIRLQTREDTLITRERCNEISVIVVGQGDSTYSVTINDNEYSVTTVETEADVILEALAEKITDEDVTVRIEEGQLIISAKERDASLFFDLSDNLTTQYVVGIVQFYTEDVGKISIIDEAINSVVTGVVGFMKVRNYLKPTYGRLQETDVEFRKSYAVKNMRNSRTMIESIVAEILEIDGVESASGSENDTDLTDSFGLPPHSVEIIVEGGDDRLIAEAILRQKAGGIGTFGSTAVDVTTAYGDVVPIRFNRPEKLYAWLEVTLDRESQTVPYNYEKVVKESILNDTKDMEAGKSLIIQTLNTGIYNVLAGVTYIHIKTAYSTDRTQKPDESEFVEQNIIASRKQSIIVSDDRIEVVLSES